MTMRDKLMAIMISAIVGCSVSYGTDARLFLIHKLSRDTGGYSIPQSDLMVGVDW